MLAQASCFGQAGEASDRAGGVLLPAARLRSGASGAGVRCDGIAPASGGRGLRAGTRSERGLCMEWYSTVLRKYAVFSGRATRTEYWMFNLINTIIALVPVLAGLALGTRAGGTALRGLGDLYMLGVVVPSLAVTVRRLHDADLSGAYLLIGLLPFLGAICLLGMLLIPSHVGDNRFGPDPKAGTPGRPVPATVSNADEPPTAQVIGGFLTCPWCGVTNPAVSSECQWCHKPYKVAPEA